MDKEEMVELMKYVEIEEKHIIDQRERRIFLDLQIVMMAHKYRMEDTSGYLRRIASLIEELLESGILDLKKEV